MCSICYMCLALRGRDGHHGNEKVPSAHTEQWQIATNKQSWKKCLPQASVTLNTCVRVCVMCPAGVFLCSTSFVVGWMRFMINNFQASSLPASLSLLQSTGSVSVSSQVPSWKAAPPPCTCATTCWSWPEASLPSPSATGNCRRCVDMARCQMASFLRGGLAADTVSNLWTERVFQMYEFRHSSLQPKWATLEHL